MASASPPKLQDIVECPICLETLTEPRMFSCFHFSCQKCVHDMKEAKQDEALGYECPLCRKFTDKEHLKSLPLVSQLVATISGSSQIAVPKCGTCEADSARWRCLDCQENYCKTCREQHDKFKLFLAHNWEEIGTSTKPVVDDVIVCEAHPSTSITHHCRDCKQLICLVCSETTHKQHTAETIEEALQQILPEVKEKQAKVKSKIETAKASLADAKTKAGAIKQMYDGLRANIQSKYEEILSKLKEDFTKLSRKVALAEDNTFGKYELSLKRFEQQLKSRENVLSASETVLAGELQNASLLRALQSGVLPRLKDALDDIDAATPEVESTELKFDGKAFGDDNLIGVVSDVKSQSQASGPLGATAQDTEHNSMSYHVLMMKTFRRESSNQVSSINISCNRFDIVSGDIWCTSGNNIAVFSTSGEKMGAVSSSRFCDDSVWEEDDLRSVVEFKGQALVATANGLFLVTSNRQLVIRICKGSFFDASVRGSVIYGLTLNEIKVIVCRKGAGFVDKRTMKLKLGDALYYDADGEMNTVVVSSENIYVAHYSGDVIQRYSLDGHLEKTHGKSSDKFESPLLCKSDALGNFLIANSGRDRLNIMTTNGKLLRLPVDGIPSPTCARVHNSRLYVSAGYGIHVFSIE